MVLFLARSRNKPVVLVREWSAIAVIVMCYFGFVSVVIEWGTASSRSISPVAGILGILAAANLLATGQNGHFVPLLQDRGPAGMIARSLMPAAMILPVLNTILRLVFAHFRIYDSTGKVALLSISILTAITILWIGASKVQDIDLLRRKAEDALRASAARMRLAQQASQVGTFEWNIQTGVNVWTPELEAMYGLPSALLPGPSRLGRISSSRGSARGRGTSQAGLRYRRAHRGRMASTLARWERSLVERAMAGLQRRRRHAASDDRSEHRYHRQQAG